LAVAVAVKLTAAFALLIVALWLVGLNVAEELVGVIVYVPLLKEVKLKLPLESAVVLAEAAPLRVTVAPEPTEAGVMDPVIV